MTSTDKRHTVVKDAARKALDEFPSIEKSPLSKLVHTIPVDADSYQAVVALHASPWPPPPPDPLAGTAPYLSTSTLSVDALPMTCVRSEQLLTRAEVDSLLGQVADAQGGKVRELVEWARVVQYAQIIEAVGNAAAHLFVSWDGVGKELDQLGPSCYLASAQPDEDLADLLGQYPGVTRVDFEMLSAIGGPGQTRVHTLVVGGGDPPVNRYLAYDLGVTVTDAPSGDTLVRLEERRALAAPGASAALFYTVGG